MKFPSKRDLYFYFDKWAFGTREQTAVLVLFLVLILVELSVALLPYLKERPQYDYTQINALISQKTAEMQQKHDSLLLNQYTPTAEILAQQEEKKSKKTSAKKTKSTQIEPILINEATVSDWEKLPGIGPKTAAAIVDFRLQNGEFQTLEDVKKVKGIGDKKFEQFKNYLRLN